MNLKLFRDEIDKIDQEILNLLKKRFDIVSKIGQLKKKQKTIITDHSREKEIFAKLNESALKLKIDRKFIHKIFRIIILQSKKIQK